MQPGREKAGSIRRCSWGNITRRFPVAQNPAEPEQSRVLRLRPIPSADGKPTLVKSCASSKPA